MESRPEKLTFVTWNTRGIQSTRNVPDKFSRVLKILQRVKAKVAFVQETHVGPQHYNTLESVSGWKVFFTVYTARSKGVAILIKDDVPFTYICHDEDHSGSYIVLFCHLYGELYTLVNVYNHTKDRSVLQRLQNYLQETADGVLVVGGDFNTVLDQYFDRRTVAVHTESSSSRSDLENFTSCLNLRDIWAHLHPTDWGFTRSENNSSSRLDMFFMPEDTTHNRVFSCKIYNRREAARISDHYPVVLKLRVQKQFEHKIPDVASMLLEFGHNSIPDRRPEKISGAEILSAIKSLIDSGEQRMDRLTVTDYKKHCCPLTEVLKINYNLMLKNKRIPPSFKEKYESRNTCIFNANYLIFSQILAKRLKVYITPSFRREKKEKLGLRLKMYWARTPEKIKFSFLNRSLLSLKRIHPALPRNFRILDSLLPKVRGTSGEFRWLQQGCPLTNTILSLTLKQLKDQILKTDSVARVCNFRNALFIQTKTNKLEAVVELMRQFSEDSGTEISVICN